MFLCNISSLRGILLSRRYFAAARSYICKLHDVCKIWKHNWKKCCVCTAVGSKTAAHCRMLAACRTKNYHLHSMCSILRQNLAQRMVLAIRCNYHFQTAWHLQRFEIDICKLDAILRFSEVQTKLQVEWYLQHVGLIICTLHICNGMVFAACCG